MSCIRPNRQQQQAAQEPGAVLLLAGPGTGKTYAVVERIRHHVTTGVDPNRILALTFSNKAAKELADRVETSTGRRLPWIGTYHAVAARLLRRDPSVAGLRPGFVIIDSKQAEQLIREAAEKVLDSKPLTKAEVDRYGSSKISPGSRTGEKRQKWCPRRSPKARWVGVGLED